MVVLKTEKILQLKSQHGRSLRVVREHYLHDDVPCNSALCLAGCQKPECRGSWLTAEVTHYVVPDCQVAKDYLEILEFPHITGIIFMQTVTHHVQHEGGRRTYKRLCQLVRDPRKESTLFCNEFHRYAYHPRHAGQTLQEWQAKSVYNGASWFYNHLAGQIPIVIVSEDSQMKDIFGAMTGGVFVVTMEEYLKNFWPDLTEAKDLYESLKAAYKEAKGINRDYHGYLAQEVLEIGLKSGRFLQGRIQVNKHNAQQEAFVTPLGSNTKNGDTGGGIFIPGMAARNRAIHGDIVVVELLPKAQWKGKSLAIQQMEAQEETAVEMTEDSDESVEMSQVLPTGQVVGVLQRNWSDYVASFDENQEKSGRRSDNVLVIPYDWRIPKIRISTTQIDKLRGQRIMVRIDSWEPDSQYPNGHFVKSLGALGDLETEISALLVQNDISVTPFSEVLLAELPLNNTDKPWVMDPAEFKQRRDLRESHLIFSIDPKGCEDVDDTLSVKKLENGDLELGVHIADVTHFVKPGSLTDLEAKSKSTTVYLADRRYDMLPAVLSADLCSLLSGVDRYAMSVMWHLDADYKVKDVWFGKTIIRSAYKLFYEVAQDCIDGADKDHLVQNIPELKQLTGQKLEKRLGELKSSISQLVEVARHIKERRTQGGALELEGVEVQIQVDKDKSTIQDLIPKQPLEIHETIAECMIFANHWVAKKICEAFPNQALLRHHPLPRQEHFETLISCAAAKGFTIETKDNKALADSLDRCVDPTDPMVNKLLRNLATQAMSNAEYFSTGSLSRDQFFHYGLALDYYTHFTSPIRRYADIIVHRLLMAALQKKDKDSVLPNPELNDLAQHINKKHRAAQYAQRESVQLFQTKFFADRTSEQADCIADGIVLQLRTNGFIVFVQRYGIKGPVYLRSKDGQVLYLPEDYRQEWTGGSLCLQEHKITVHSVLGSHTYRLFDHVTVRISVQASHAHSSSLKLELVANKPNFSDVGHDIKQQKAEMIKRVKDDRGVDEEDDVDTVRLGVDYDQLKAEYGQTPREASLYSLYQHLYDSSLLEA